MTLTNINTILVQRYSPPASPAPIRQRLAARILGHEFHSLFAAVRGEVVAWK